LGNRLIIDEESCVGSRGAIQRRQRPGGMLIVGAGEKEHQFRRFDEQRSRRRGGGTTLKKIL